MYVTVEVEQGTLRGQQKTSDYFSHKKYFSFQGIPFAKPPLGPLRFKDPEEPEAWSGVRDALKEGNDCFQYHLMFKKMIGSEDCLYLNVYTPQLNGDAGLPVMVWVHGGGFVTGSGSTELYGPDYFIEQDVIIVTINYRLSVLGFLCLNKEASGNAGLKDQVIAFRWVQKNIAKFGGDPNRVTIFGESAGGASISHQLISPLSQGLYQHAIVQSGSVLSSWALIDRATAIDRAFSLGKALGCDTKDTEKLLEFLREVPVSDLFTNVYSILSDDEDIVGLKMVFLPCVEVPATSQSFLPVLPRELLEQGKFAKVPTIIGTTSAEGMLSLLFLDLSEDNFPKVYKNIEKFIIQDLGLSAGSDKAKQISKELKQFYFGDSPVTVDKLDSFFELYGDLMFYYGIDECVRLTVDNKEAAPIYAYEFTHTLSNSSMKVFQQVVNPGGGNFKGVNHGEDLSVLFAHNMEGMPKPSTEDQEFIAEVTKMWANFAKTGNPNYYGMEATWAPVKKNNFCHLEIGRELKLVPERVKQERMTMWQQLYDKHRSSQ